MENLTKRDEQTIRFLKWIQRNSGFWYLICTPGDEHMNPNMMQKILEMLVDEQFYEIIFVLLMVHRKADFVDSALKTMLLEMILTGWEGKGNCSVRCSSISIIFKIRLALPEGVFVPASHASTVLGEVYYNAPLHYQKRSAKEGSQQYLTVGSPFFYTNIGRSRLMPCTFNNICLISKEGRGTFTTAHASLHSILFFPASTDQRDSQYDD